MFPFQKPLKNSNPLNKARNNLFLLLQQIQQGFAETFGSDTDLHNHFKFLPAPSDDSPAVTLDTAKTDLGSLISQYFLDFKNL